MMDTEDACAVLCSAVRALRPPAPPLVCFAALDVLAEENITTVGEMSALSADDFPSSLELSPAKRDAIDWLVRAVTVGRSLGAS